MDTTYCVSVKAKTPGRFDPEGVAIAVGNNT